MILIEPGLSLRNDNPLPINSDGKNGGAEQKSSRVLGVELMVSGINY